MSGFKSLNAVIALTGALLLISGCATTKDDYAKDDYAKENYNKPAEVNKDIPALMTQAYDKINSGDFAVAEEQLLQARKLEPEDPWVALNLGVVYQRTGRIDLAKAEYQRAIVARQVTVAANATDSNFVKSSAADIARHNLANLYKDRPVVATAPPMPAPMPAPVPDPVPVAAPVVTAPPVAVVTAPAPAPVRASNPRAEIEKLIMDWRAAWRAKDLPSYFSYYDPAFTGKKKSRKSWEADRRRIMGKASDIQIGLNSPTLTFEGSERAVVVFKQSYDANNYRDKGSKMLHLDYVDGRWQIANETFSFKDF